MTYSLIARDPATGAFGVAAQSHWFNVGQPVAWVRFGVGAVATQASADPSYGWHGLALMAEGVEPTRALRDLSRADAGREQRQVAMMNASGAVATRTGSECIDYAGHLTGDGWSAQARILPFIEEPTNCVTARCGYVGGSSKRRSEWKKKHSGA